MGHIYLIWETSCCPSVKIIARLNRSMDNRVTFCLFIVIYSLENEVISVKPHNHSVR